MSSSHAGGHFGERERAIAETTSVLSSVEVLLCVRWNAGCRAVDVNVSCMLLEKKFLAAVVAVADSAAANFQIELKNTTLASVCTL